MEKSMKKLILTLLFCLGLSSSTKAQSLDCGTHSLDPGDTETIQSADYPNPYPSGGQNCAWHFEVSNPDSYITITCEVTGLQRCRRSSIRITDDAGLNKRFCRGTTTIEESSTNNVLSVQFVASQSGRNRDGKFQCTVSASEPVTMTVSDDCQCGQVMSVTKIVGGLETDIHEYPWQVALVSPSDPNSRPFCGGSLISNEFVVTAAHCVDGATEDEVVVVVGEHDYTTSIETDATQRLSLSEITVHPNYNSVTIDSDIALLKLSSPITFSEEISPVCLPTAGNLYVGEDAISTGWGLLQQGGEQPNVLQEVDLQIFSNNECINLNGNVVTSNMICAGLLEGGKGPCHGDSGGPLITDSSTNDFYELVGVTSFGFGCAQENSPAVYARVEQFLNWIKRETVGSTFCSRT